jgi:hypothetical protein
MYSCRKRLKIVNILLKVKTNLQLEGIYSSVVYMHGRLVR